MSGNYKIQLIPQPKQNLFLGTSADVAVYGGAAGGGKSWALLAECLRHRNNPRFGATIFRRTRQQITNEGGLWDEAMQMFPHFTPFKPNLTDLDWHFPNPKNKRLQGANVGFSGLQYDADVLQWQGSQIALLGFDELTHFTQHQFFYMLSRNRSVSGVVPYVRATTNADAESWVAELVDWYIDKDGYAIQDRAGKLRYFVRENDKLFWGDNRDELAAQFPHLLEQFGDAKYFVKSFTFIPALVYDNAVLMRANPTYLANLMSLPLIERERLLGGNWKIKASAGKVYNREWFQIDNELANGGIDVRYFDFAATEKKLKTTAKKTPDYTATTKIRYNQNKQAPRWVFTDAFQIQAAPANVEKLFFQIIEMDIAEARRRGVKYKVRWEIEPGSASRRENYRLVSMLPGVDAKGAEKKEDKVTASKGLSRQAEVGNVGLLSAGWNNELLSHLHGFPDLAHDDLADASSGAFNQSLEDSDESMSD